MAAMQTEAPAPDDGKLRIIIFGAHPDDAEYRGAGVAMKWAKMGHHVKFVSATNGDIGHWQIAGGPLAQRRLKEVLEAISADMSAKVATADPNRQVSGSEPVQEAVDERMGRRIKVHRRAWLSSTKGGKIQECIVCDESAVGARLMICVEAEISARLYLYMSPDSTSPRDCRVVWRSNTQIGVEFLC